MPIFHAIVLGITQGLTEFLPVSSSGHLGIIPWLFQWNDFGGDTKMENTFDVALHLGTLLGSVVCLWGDVRTYSRAGLLALVGRRPWNEESKFGWFLLLSALPAALVAASFESFFLTQSNRIGLIASGLGVFGVLLWLVDRGVKAQPATQDLTIWRAAVLGCGQCLALFPGVSRSGIGITVARTLGYDRSDAARLAFLMGLPIIGGAALYRLIGLISDGLPNGMWSVLAAGTISSAVTGWLAVRVMLRWVKTHSYAGFAAYRVCLALAVAMVLLAR
ncbi:MAG TPA: undecaprenyl-diphosphatase [Acidimicrobiaceae bacterium]|nr:undecaprenyl-diphosphatase [Acidimicrobiaceae bacterium]|tara:strand:- start:147 stop:974 length:828 start_codon:yes stop_codon:yes gene_type:complete